MTFDDVVDACVTLFRTATSGDVFDGPEDGVFTSTDFVVVGSTGEDTDGGTINLDPSTLGAGDWYDETGEVFCAAWSWCGEVDISGRRARAASALSACVEAVAADRTLGGLLIPPGFAWVTDVRYVPVRTDKGTGARFLFTVSYRTLNT